MSNRFDDVYRRSLEDSEAFWAEAAEVIHWDKKWDRVLDFDNPPFFRWFVGAECNTCYNAVERPRAGGDPHERVVQVPRLPRRAPTR